MTDPQHLTDLRQSFSRQFPAHKTPPRIFRAPGRTNLIGEHTDYNDGFVLPAAIDRVTYLAIAPRQRPSTAAMKLRSWLAGRTAC